MGKQGLLGRSGEGKQHNCRCCLLSTVNLNHYNFACFFTYFPLFWSFLFVLWRNPKQQTVLLLYCTRDPFMKVSLGSMLKVC